MKVDYIEVDDSTEVFETAIIVPLYNEEKVVAEVLLRLREKYPKFAIVVVDDCSEDDSYNKACVPGVFLLRHIVNLGQGAALQTGIEFARQIGCKFVVTFDSDGQHNPNDIRSFIDKLREDKYDIILGSRFLGITENMPRGKKYLLKLSRFFTWAATGILLTDSHNGFRAINIEKFPDFEIRQNRMAHASEIIGMVKSLKMRYKEMPCSIKYSKYTLKKGQSMWNSINIVLDFFVGNLMKW